MDVNSLSIAKVFSSGGDIHYVLPHFQREYAWDKENWVTLLSDARGIYESYNDDKSPEHFLGALVVIDDGNRSGTIPAFKLVDGQQRLTTLSLALCALADQLDTTDGEDKRLVKRIRKLLINEDERGELFFKLLPTLKNDDRAVYSALIDPEATVPAVPSRIKDAYAYFHKEFAVMLRSGYDADTLYKVFVNGMHVVFIALSPDERPFDIFESLNAKGKPLTQPDLVRNYVAMRLSNDVQEIVFEEWRSIEDSLDENRTVSSRLGEVSAFLRHYLAMHSGVLANSNHIYARFRDRMERDFSDEAAFVEELRTLGRFASYYERFLYPDRETDPVLRAQLERLLIIETATAYPLLLRIFDWHDRQVITQQDLLDALRIVENYLIRRWLAGEISGYTNRMFPTLLREIDPSDLIDSLASTLATKNYPSDQRIRSTLPNRNVYPNRTGAKQRLVLLLQSINEGLSAGSGGHTVLNGSPTVEHIMPQTLNQTWRHELGASADETYREYLHTLGNLTLVTQDWNGSLSNSSFANKRPKLAQHALRLNSDYFSDAPARWDQAAIAQRADWLIDQALTLWPPFGDPSSATQDGVKNTRPVTLTLLGETHEVRWWAEVVRLMADTIAELMGADFDEAARQMGSSFRTEPFKETYQLQTAPHWYMNLNLSAENIYSLCERLAEAANLTDEDWTVDYVPY